MPGLVLVLTLGLMIRTGEVTCEKSDLVLLRDVGEHVIYVQRHFRI